MNIEKARALGAIGDIHVFCNGKPIQYVIEFMTGSDGFAFCYEQSKRIVGDSIAVKQVRGDITFCIGLSE